MDPSRKANREDTETTLQYQSPQDAQLVEELNQHNLNQLLARIGQLEQSPHEAAELKRRIKLFGACERIEGEPTGQFHARLRLWLEKELPPAKSPLHPPRQTGN